MRYLLFLLGFLILSSCSLEETVKTVFQSPATETDKTTSSEPKPTKSSPVVLSNRIALVIGNAAYAEKPLVNPVNDANDMADVLKKLGFEVILKTDANLRTMVESMRDFSNRLSDNSVSLFYFSGHGNQYNNNNYLIPLESNIAEESDFPREALPVGDILEKMEDKNRNGVNLVFLDACRSNPFGGKRFKSGGSSHGLASMAERLGGSLVAYATSPSKVADDNPGGRNAVYTKHLLAMLREMPQKNIFTLLAEVRLKVKAETGNKQVPREENALTVPEFCLALDGCESTTQPEVATMPTPSEKLSISSSFHAIVVADQADKYIDPQQDIAKVRELISEARRATCLKGEDIFIEARTDARKKIEDTLRRLLVGTDDVVLFYYSGYGANPGDGDRWPSMNVEGRNGGNLLKLSSVKSILQSKKPRLLIVIADTSNHFIERNSSSSKNLLPFNSVKNIFQNKNESFLIAMADNDTFLRKVGFRTGLGPADFKKLFLGYKGTIIASASIPGRYAFGNLQNGGFFTQQLLEAIKSSNDADWNRIMDNTKRVISIAPDQDQQPQARVEITPLGERTEFNNRWDCPTW